MKPETRRFGFLDQDRERKSGLKEVRICSADLFARTRVVVIEHKGDEYRLRLTGSGKLILTK